MSKIQINADFESSESMFDYRGADLQRPLEDLREHLLTEARRTMDRIGLKSTADLPVLADLTKRDHDAEAKQKIKLALGDAFEAQLWAQECKRTPDAVWRLRMTQLKWLYRQHAPK